MMYKEEFVKNLAKNLGVSQIKANEIYQAVEKTFIDACVNHGGITIRGLISIKTKWCDARIFKHPSTGKKTMSEPHVSLKTKAGKTLNDLINAKD